LPAGTGRHRLLPFPERDARAGTQATPALVLTIGELNGNPHVAIATDLAEHGQAVFR